MPAARVQTSAFSLDAGFSGSVSQTRSFFASTTDGNLLVCLVFTIVDPPSGGPFYANPAPSTSGISWTLAGTAGVSFDKGSSNFATRSCEIYYCLNAPPLASGASTTVSFSAGPPGTTVQLGICLVEFSGIGAFDSVAVGNPAAASHANFSIATTPVAGLLGGTSDGLVIAISNSIFYNIGHSGGTIGPTSDQTGICNNGFGQLAVYQATPSAGTYTGGFAGSMYFWSVVAVAFVSGVTVGGGGAGGCGDCPGPHLLELIPGFSDLPDSVLQTDDVGFALHVGEIAVNATFGMVRCETFVCTYKHGDTVPLPTSCWDGYVYSREELTYLWAVQSSLDPSTNWISGPDALWFMNWNVVQSTGEVFCEEWYERSSTADSRLAAKSNDGLLVVYTIGQRQKTNMIMGATASYTSISESTIATDKPYTQDLAQHLNQNAKFSCVNSEVFYLGEYTNAQTVKLPVSPVDGYTYSSAECQFQHAWRWTASSGTYVQPPGNLEQAAPFQASINSSGVVSISVSFSTSGGENVTTPSGYGRIAAFAFCTRSATPSTGALANNFTELGLDFFAPGRTVRASELLTIKRNIDEAILSPEFFGPTDYHDAATVTLPVSTVDGYTYSRDEVQYIWSWSDVKNNSGGTHVRLPLFLGSIDPTTGVVKLRCWRLPPGGPYVDDSNTNALIRVLVMATRQAIHPGLALGATDATTPADAGTVVTDGATYTVNGT